MIRFSLSGDLSARKNSQKCDEKKRNGSECVIIFAASHFLCVKNGRSRSVKIEFSNSVAVLSLCLVLSPLFDCGTTIGDFIDPGQTGVEFAV